MSTLPSRVNVGCGPTPTPGWINLDNSLSVWLARYPWLAHALARFGLLAESQGRLVSVARKAGIVWADATRRIPARDCSVEVIYASHMMEHLDREEARRFLREAHRVLAPSGIIRIAVPDLRKLVDDYLVEGDADSFIERTLLTHQKPTRLLEKLKYLLVGNRAHQWMYDGASLSRLLSGAGFVKPRTVEAGSTSIAQPGELDLYERADESTFVEAYRV